jgi:hypothetical protein
MERPCSLAHYIFTREPVPPGKYEQKPRQGCRGFWNSLDIQTIWMNVSTKIVWLKLYDHFAVATNFNFNGVG